MKKHFLAAIILTLTIVSCKGPEQKYTDWLYKYMPLPDRMHYGRSYWEENVRKTLETREKMAWDIPEREFRHFVLPLRVNNETLDDFRTVYADTLCARVKGMSIADAALEINHWCHEQATYAPSDARTSAPEATVLRGLGRCGEESVLTVAALRAAGIPARQVYTPRWAHTDDNHAWVEVFTGDGWHFMGACEPEPALDMGWFNGAVSRAMILHTKVYGDYNGPEDVIQRTPCYTEINVIRGYVPARRTNVTVTVDGKPAEGAKVSFRIYNYAEFYSVVTYETDSRGHAALDTGLGDMLVFAWKDGRFGFAVAGSENTSVELSHHFGEEFSEELDIVPPPENPLRTGATPEMIAANATRLALEDGIRLSHNHDNPAVAAFRANYPSRADEIIGSLSAKDYTDVSYEVLEDALLGTGSERIEIEHLRPYRKAILESGEVMDLQDRNAVMQWCRDNILIDNAHNPQNLRTSPEAVWRERKADSLAFKIFYVALCRTLGIDASYDLVTGTVESKAPKGLLRPTSDKYFRDWTLTRVGESGTSLLDYEETGLPEVLEVEEGYYLLTTGRRMADGSVLARLEFFNVKGGEDKILNPVVRISSDRPSVIGSMDAEALFLKDGAAAPQSLLSATGRGYFLVAVMGHRDEPTSHARTELEAAAPLLNSWGRPVVILGKTRPAGLQNAVYGTDVAVMESLGKEKLPVVALCDSFGRIVYITEGYNTSLASDLESIIPKL